MHTRLAILLCLFICQVKAQVNLVPNNSFEQFDTCPDFLGQINRVSEWSSPTNSTPEILTGNFCDIYLNSNYINLPNNSYIGYQNARSGKSAAGLVMYSNSTNGINREYLQIKLINKLKINTLYCFQYYVNVADILSKYVIKDFGAYFSPDSIYVYGTPPNYPVLEFPTSILLA